MKKLLATLTTTFLVCIISQPVSAKILNLNFPSENIKMSMNITPSKKNTNVKVIFFEGLTDCPAKNSTKVQTAIERCLKFHTQFSEDVWSYVPVKLIYPFKPTLMYKHLENIPTIKQDRKETYKWGTVYNWSTETFGSAHYIFLRPKSKNYAIQMGPFAGMVLINYELNLKNIDWK